MLYGIAGASLAAVSAAIGGIASRLCTRTSERGWRAELFEQDHDQLSTLRVQRTCQGYVASFDLELVAVGGIDGDGQPDRLLVCRKPNIAV
jgi:hypothetical protein